MLGLILRHLYSNKFLLLLIFVLNLRDFLEQLHTYEFKRYPLEQIYSKSQIKQCEVIFESLEYDYQSSTHNIFSHLLAKTGSRRKTQIFRSKSGVNKIIAKSYPKSLEFIKLLNFPLNRELLKREFHLQAPSLDFQFCPHESIQRFVNFFSTTSGYNETTVWLFMLTNAQLFLQPYLQKHGFPVPQTFGICGFTAYQEHVGQTVEHFYPADFQIKLRIVRQLLEAALIFTNGFEGYRIYITDLTSDNLVYNVERDKLYFVDLNTVYIVDANSTIDSDGVDHHDLIACDNCFAFVPDRLCTNGLSDLNVLESCLFIREDLKGDQTKGFLKPIPAEMEVKYPNLVQLLDECVEGATYKENSSVNNNNNIGNYNMSRFMAAIKLIELLTNISGEN
ncbi:PREDICTED: uncharacterized protein LOC108358466 [Rhagoletis zephyria]|uniref:uncharacterized protein LOC108358466 n=1 Tax=Rhagoletis zephyria TaxID=28612 RepID=UPI000811A044|nr:PREDICTED: uncharacterized protein LOC108358466 [Rhagoletis zephyria]